MTAMTINSGKLCVQSNVEICGFLYLGIINFYCIKLNYCRPTRMRVLECYFIHTFMKEL